jgi:prevent-host-death family protein
VALATVQVLPLHWRAITLPYSVTLQREHQMDIIKDIQPMTTFRNNSAEFMRHLRETKRPIILTVNGQAAAILQDAESYQRLLDLAAEANAAEGIRQGLEDLANGRTQLAMDVFEEIRAEYDIPR